MVVNSVVNQLQNVHRRVLLSKIPCLIFKKVIVHENMLLLCQSYFL